MADQINKTKSWYLLAIILIVIAIYFWVGQSSQKDPPPETIPKAEKIPQADSGQSSVGSGLVAVNKTQTERPVAHDEKPVNPVSTPAWSIATPESVSMSLPNGVVVYEPVSVDMDSPFYPEPGVQVSLHLPGEQEALTATVKSSNENPNGDYSWRGYLDGHGTEYPVIMTYGANSVFATVTTPKGSYTLESVNGSGWIYKSPSEFELSHPGVGDSLEIPHDHQ